MAIEIAILTTSACMGLSSVHTDVCNKSLEAGFKQSGLEQMVDGTQKYIEKRADVKAHYLLGDTGMGVVSVGIFIAKTVRDKAVNFNMPTIGICDKITNHVGTDKYAVELIWVLP